MSNFDEYLRGLNLQTVEEIEAVASFRPTIYIGLGGFGCAVLQKLKSEIAELAPDQIDGFAFLGLDTHPRDHHRQLTLNEYVPLSLGADPQTIAKGSPRFLGWFRPLMANFRAKTITSGADKVKAVGRLAFKNPPTFADFANKLLLAANRLRQPRQKFAQGVPTKVYVIATLAGGTGAGCLLDVLATAGKRFRDIEGADFPYQAIVATPDVLMGEASMQDLDDFYANTFATLKEIHHFLATGAEQVVDYDDGDFARLAVSQAYLPDLIHLIGDKTEKGAAVSTLIDEMADMVVAYLLSEIQTPMHDQGGQPKVQDLENQFAGALGRDDMPRAFSSFGVVRTGIPIDLVRNLFCLKLSVVALANEVAEPPAMAQEAANWIAGQGLKESDSDQLRDQIKASIIEPLKIAVDAKGELLRHGAKYDDLKNRCEQFVAKVEKALADEKKPLIDGEGTKVEQKVCSELRRQIDHLLEQGTVGKATAFLDKLSSALAVHQQSLAQQAADARKKLQEVHRKGLEQSIANVQSAIPGWWDREDRVGKALDNFELRLEGLLTAQLDLWVKEIGEKVYSTLVTALGEQRSQWQPVGEALAGYLKAGESLIIAARAQLDSLADIEKRGPGNRFSLINGDRAEDALPAGTRSAGAGGDSAHPRWLRDGRLADATSNAEQWLTTAAAFILEHEIEPGVQGLTFNAIMKQFYPGDAEQRRLFDSLLALSAPLFWLDPNRLEPGYHSYWIIAVHPGQQHEFVNGYSRYLPGDGRVFAYFDSPHEVVLYQLKMGYTLHSHQGLHTYEATYNRLEKTYREGLGRKPIRPIHCWPEALEWEGIPPSRAEEETMTWFIVGRAFSYLYPKAAAAAVPDVGRKEPKLRSGTYLFSRGSNYYLALEDDERPIALGNGLNEALENFGLHPEWQAGLKNKIELKIEELGKGVVRKRLEDEYMPLLNADIETAENAAGDATASDDEATYTTTPAKQRAVILRKLSTELKRFIKDLTPTNV